MREIGKQIFFGGTLGGVWLGGARNKTLFPSYDNNNNTNNSDMHDSREHVPGFSADLDGVLICDGWKVIDLDLAPTQNPKSKP